MSYQPYTVHKDSIKALWILKHRESLKNDQNFTPLGVKHIFVSMPQITSRVYYSERRLYTSQCGGFFLFSNCHLVKKLLLQSENQK